MHADATYIFVKFLHWKGRWNFICYYKFSNSIVIAKWWPYYTLAPRIVYLGCVLRTRTVAVCAELPVLHATCACATPVTQHGLSPTKDRTEVLKSSLLHHGFGLSSRYVLAQEVLLLRVVGVFRVESCLFHTTRSSLYGTPAEKPWNSCKIT